MRDLNLAKRPFVNVKPVRRAGFLMLMLGIGLLAVNGALYWKHFSGESETRGQSQDLNRMIAEEEAEIRRLQDQIAGVDIGLLNQRARYVNTEIDRRGFSWSKLFDQLVEAQPRGVRLLTMSPQFARSRRGSARRQRAEPDEVTVELLAIARHGEAILEFIDNLFQHPAFREPDISREAQYEDDTIGFDISVLYDPAVPLSTVASDLASDGTGTVAEEDSNQSDDSSNADGSET